MQSIKRKTLHFIDFIVLAIIFFGYPTYLAVQIYFLPSPQVQASTNVQSFTDQHNISTIILELFLLLIAGIYLYFRRFDFRTFNFSIHKKTILQVLLLIIVGAVAADIGTYGYYYFDYYMFPIQPAKVSPMPLLFSSNLFQHISFFLVIFSFLNGFFEELFFMGIVFAVNDKHKIYAIVGSLFVRFIFHIYQGIAPAVGIMMMGLVFIFIRRKVKSLVPFMLAHAFFDIFGVTLYSWIYTLLM